MNPRRTVRPFLTMFSARPSRIRTHPTVDAPTLDLDPRKIAELAHGRRGPGSALRRLRDPRPAGLGGHGGRLSVVSAQGQPTGRPQADQGRLVRRLDRGDHPRGRDGDFRNEAQVLGRLEHDHIVPLYDVGQAEGLLFFSMRLINGRSLGQMFLSDGPLAPRRAAYYIEAIARAIQYAHDHQVLHRDVKPGNILVGENDRPYLIDLGLAKSLEATDYTTLTGKALGTAAYMSPEQARGERRYWLQHRRLRTGGDAFHALDRAPAVHRAQPDGRSCVRSSTKSRPGRASGTSRRRRAQGDLPQVPGEESGQQVRLGRRAGRGAQEVPRCTSRPALLFRGPGPG